MGSRSDLASLSEGQVVYGVELTRAQAVALNNSRLVSVAPAADGWTVTAAYAVGALRCGDLDVRVQPKVGAIQVLRLLARAEGVKDLKLDEDSIAVSRDADLTVVLATFFAQEAASAMLEGPLRGYRTEDQSLSVVRGRIRIRDQELRRFGQLAPLEVRVDEWTADTDENRMILAATHRLLRLPVLPDLVRRQLGRLDRQLAGVHSLPHGSSLGRPQLTRLNTRLHNLLALAELVLAARSVEHRVGDIAIRGFVLSMPLLFERLVGRLLSETQAPWRLAEQRRTGLDIGRRLAIKPDLTLLRHGKAVAVADLKYKLLDESGSFPNADAYQLIAYCSRLGLAGGHLIYAAGDPCPEPYDIVGAGVRLIVHSIDLTTSMENLEKQVAALAAVLCP